MLKEKADQVVHRVIIVSGYFNPIHSGHLDYIEGARKLGDEVIVIVNNDAQVALKGSTPFMSEKDRVRIVEALGDVSEAVLSIDEDETVVKSLEVINAALSSRSTVVFANGGDRVSDVPEVKFCGEHDIECVFNVGGEKSESSSNLLSRVLTNENGGVQ